MRLQAAEESRQRAQEEALLAQAQAELDAEKMAYSEVERQIQVQIGGGPVPTRSQDVLHELRADTERHRVLLEEHAQAVQTFEVLRAEMDSQLYVADNSRIEAELQARKAMREVWSPRERGRVLICAGVFRALLCYVA